MKKVGVILSGCGVNDGSEIHEAVAVLLAIDRAGATAVCLAPRGPQAGVTDHATGLDQGESRDMLVESARIARGAIKDIAGTGAAELDALVLPGGFGAARNLSTFAAEGPDCRVDPGVERLLQEMLRQRKPVGALCIAPGLLAKVLQNAGIRARLTIGHDRDTAAAITAMGHQHVDCAAHEVVIDEDHKLVTSPAYMTARRISEVAAGAQILVDEVLRRA